MKIWLAAVSLVLGISVPAFAGDYAARSAPIAARMACRRSGGQRLSAVALKQAQAMAASGSISHSAAGSFSSRVAPLRKSRAAENIAAGFLSFAETLKQWENSAGHRANLLMPGAKKVGVASVANAGSPYRMFWAMVITD